MLILALDFLSRITFVIVETVNGSVRKLCSVLYARNADVDELSFGN